jgi:hypothetical protein
LIDHIFFLRDPLRSQFSDQTSILTLHLVNRTSDERQRKLHSIPCNALADSHFQTSEAMPRLQSNKDPIAIAACVPTHPLEEIRGDNEDLQNQSVGQLNNTLEAMTKSLSAHIQGEKVDQALPAWELLQKATRVNTYYCISVRDAQAEAAEMQAKIMEEIQESGRYYGGFRARALQAKSRLVEKEVAKLPDVEKHWDVLQQMRPVIEECFTERVLAALKARITFFQGPLVKQRQSPIFQSLDSGYTSELNKLNKLKEFGDLALQFYMDLVTFTYITLKDLGKPLETAQQSFWAEARRLRRVSGRRVDIRVMTTDLRGLIEASHTYSEQINNQLRKQSDHFKALDQFCAGDEDLTEMLAKHKADLASNKMQISLVYFKDKRPPHRGRALYPDEEDDPRNMVHVRLCSLTGAEWDSSIERSKNEFQNISDSKFGKSLALEQLLSDIDNGSNKSSLQARQAAPIAESARVRERIAKAKAMKGIQKQRAKNMANEQQQKLANAKAMAMNATQAHRAKKGTEREQQKLESIKETQAHGAESTTEEEQQKPEAMDETQTYGAENTTDGDQEEAEAEHEYWNRGRTRPRPSLKHLSVPYLANSTGLDEIYRPNEWRQNRWFDSLVEGSDEGSDSEDEKDVETHDGKETYLDIHKGLFDRGDQPGLDYELAAGPRPRIESEYDEDFWALRTTSSWATTDLKTG